MTATHITTTITDVLEGWQGDDLERIDHAATNSAYVTEFTRRLQEAFPEAELHIESQPNVYGSLPTYVRGDDTDKDEVTQEMYSINEDMMAHYEQWVVYQD